MDKLKIMIADDSKELVQTMLDFFKEEEDIKVVGAYTDGVQLLSALKTTQIDLLILDVFMPNCDGLKVL